MAGATWEINGNIIVLKIIEPLFMECTACKKELDIIELQGKIDKDNHPKNGHISFCIKCNACGCTLHVNLVVDGYVEFKDDKN